MLKGYILSRYRHGPPAGVGHLSWHPSWPALRLRGGAAPASTSSVNGVRSLWHVFDSDADTEDKRRREQEKEIAASREAVRKAREDRLERDMEDRGVRAGDNERNDDSMFGSLTAAAGGSVRLS